MESFMDKISFVPKNYLYRKSGVSTNSNDLIVYTCCPFCHYAKSKSFRSFLLQKKNIIPTGAPEVQVPLLDSDEEIVASEV